jgi:hypothetical protein
MEANLGTDDEAGSRTGLFLRKQDADFFSVGLLQQRARLVLGAPDGARLQAGVLTTNDGSYVSLIDQSDTERAVMSASGSKTLLTLEDNNMQVDLGSYESDRYGLYLSKDGAVRANLRFSPDGGGAVNVANTTGKLVAGIIGSEEGGRMVVTGPQGGVTLASLAGDPEGGRLALYDPEGNPLVDGAATKTGHLQVTSSNGGIVMTTGESAPRLEVSDGAGTVLIQAGVTTDGVGIVRTGPGGNGPAGVLGAGLKAASSIQGKD